MECRRISKGFLMIKQYCFYLTFMVKNALSKVYFIHHDNGPSFPNQFWAYFLDFLLLFSNRNIKHALRVDFEDDLSLPAEMVKSLNSVYLISFMKIVSASNKLRRLTGFNWDNLIIGAVFQWIATNFNDYWSTSSQYFSLTKWNLMNINHCVHKNMTGLKAINPRLYSEWRIDCWGSLEILSPDYQAR